MKAVPYRGAEMRRQLPSSPSGCKTSRSLRLASRSLRHKRHVRCAILLPLPPRAPASLLLSVIPPPPPPPQGQRRQTHPMRIGAPTVTFRECVLDVGRVPTGGSQPRRPLLKSRFHRVDRALPTGRCLSLHPVLCLPARVPMSSTHSRRFCKIGAPTVTFPAHRP